MEYVRDTQVADSTPPPAPTAVQIQGNKITWQAEADFESGLAKFIVRRDGKFLANVPKKSANRFGRAIFQGLQYSDTPDQPLVKMEFTDETAREGFSHSYEVIAVNTAELKSAPAAN